MNKSFKAALRTTLLSTILVLGFAIAFVAVPGFDSARAVTHPGQTLSRASRTTALTERLAAATATPVGDVVSTHASIAKTRNSTNSRNPTNPSRRPSRLANNSHRIATASARVHPSAAAPPHVILQGILEDDSPVSLDQSQRGFSRPALSLPMPQSHDTIFSAVRGSDSSRIEARLISMENQLAQLAGSQLEKQATELQRATQLMQQLQQSAQQLQQSTQLNNLESELQRLQTAQSENDPKTAADSAEETTGNTATGNKQPILKAEPAEDDPESFSLTIQDAEITEVLGMLGQLSGLNILAGKGVTGAVTANLQDVTIDEALGAIARSADLDYERDGDFIFVLPAVQAEARRTSSRRIVTKVYRPQYISSTDLSQLLTPLLTTGIGLIASTQASERGIPPDGEQAGGDSLSQTDALLVRDYEDIINEMDQVISEMDVPPMQVVIDAKILSVRLTDEMAFGVNFALLSGNQKDLFVSGNGATLNGSSGLPDGTSANTIIPAMGEFLAQTAGLKYGFVQNDVSAFINALENIADTNLIAAPQLRVVNKQKAELIIGNRISYRTLAFNGTQTVESVNFLDVGTKLLMRPFISPDGNVRLEVHPERSSAVIDQQTGLPNQDTTEVTTNVMIRDGRTVVIGGLIEEQIAESLDKVPILGSLPIVGAAFRNKTERIDRNELIILLTPRIVRDPVPMIDAESQEAEYNRRSQYFSDHLAPVNRRNLSRIYRERAQFYLDRGDHGKARFFAKQALRNNKNELDSLRLLDQIDATSGRYHWFGSSEGAEFLVPSTSPEEIPLEEITTDEWSLPTIPPAADADQPQ